jgi:hypothetical protein
MDTHDDPFVMRQRVFIHARISVKADVLSLSKLMPNGLFGAYKYSLCMKRGICVMAPFQVLFPGIKLFRLFGNKFVGE